MNVLSKDLSRAEIPEEDKQSMDENRQLWRVSPLSPLLHIVTMGTAQITSTNNKIIPGLANKPRIPPHFVYFSTGNTRARCSTAEHAVRLNRKRKSLLPCRPQLLGVRPQSNLRLRSDFACTAATVVCTTGTCSRRCQMDLK